MDQDIIHPPFTMCWPRYIMYLQSRVGPQTGAQDIYPPPLQNGSARIYLPPFPTGRLIYIHTPSQRVGRDISYAFRMGRPGYSHPLPGGPRGVSHVPSTRVGPDISNPPPHGSAEI